MAPSARARHEVAKRAAKCITDVVVRGHRPASDLAHHRVAAIHAVGLASAAPANGARFACLAHRA